MAQDLSAWSWAYPWLAVVAAYLIGSLSFAVLVSRAMGLKDPRSYGSQNPGATNVLRSGNKLAAVLTLLLDAAKGWLPVWALRLWGEAYGLGEASLALVALAAFLGHLYPVFFAFKGGKGVATAAGVLLGLELWLGLACLATWLIVAFFTRYSSLAALVTAVFAPLFYLLGDRVVWQAPGSAVLVVALIGLLLVWRHADNINRLFAGTEGKIGAKK